MCMINITMDLESAIKRAYAAARCNFSAPWCVITRLYSSSTEITEDYLKDFDFKEKRIMTVGSSGDQVLTFAYLGSKDITLMDANPLTPFFVNLKLAAIKTLTREEFISFFKQDNNRFIDMLLYGKIRESLDETTKVFWDKLYDEELQDKIFHIYSSASESSIPPYLTNDDAYLELRNKLNDVKINFHQADISTFNEHMDGEYYLIDLSNIYTYVKSEKYWESIDKIYPHLTKDGYLKLHYDDTDKIDEFNYLNKKSFSVSVKDINNVFIIWQNDEYLYEQNHINKAI